MVKVPNAHINEIEVERDRITRRRGGAFDTLARVFRGVRFFEFANGLIFKNRPGRPVDREEFLETGLLPYSSMAETYFKNEPTAGSLNGITLGRQGDGKFRNTNTILLEANHNTSEGDSLGYSNGVVRARVSRDSVDESDKSGLYIMDRGTESSAREGTVNWLVAAGEGGQVRLSYMPDKTGNPLTDAIFDVYITESGITLYGVPTSDPGGSGRVWNDGGTLKIT